MDSNNELEFYELARKKSVNRTREQAQQREREYEKSIYRKGRREGYTSGAKNGLKKGFITGAIVAIIACSGFTMGKDALVSRFGSDYSNPSVTAGYQVVGAETHRTDDMQNYWYDYYDIARGFDAETMDFDSFVYGNYRRVGWNESSRLSCMDELFYQFHSLGLTDFNSFVAYCEDKGVCKEVDGKLEVNTKAYENAVRAYIASLNEIQDLEEDVESFRHGM